MIQVSFHFFNILAHIAGTRLVPRKLENGTSLIDAIRILALEYPAAFENLLSPEGSISNYLKVFVNGHLISQNELHTLLHDGDEIMLFPAAAGG